MELRYLGTAAAEGWPALFCDCPACRRARAAGGRDLRSRSQALLDGRLLIDLPPDTFHHCLTQGLDLSFLSDLLITHTHEDHWYPEDLQYRGEGFAAYSHPQQVKPLTVWGPAGIAEAFEGKLAPLCAPRSGRLAWHVLRPFEPVDIAGYRVTPLPANHDPASTPLIYQITDAAQRTLLYANDTGVPCEEVWQWWAAHPVHFDLLSLDCTGIVHPWRDGHMGLAANAEVVQRLREMGLANEDTRVCLNHFSHNGRLTYDELCAQVAPQGWLVSYDGLRLQI